MWQRSKGERHRPPRPGHADGATSGQSVTQTPGTSAFSLVNLRGVCACGLGRGDVCRYSLDFYQDCPRSVIPTQG